MNTDDRSFDEILNAARKRRLSELEHDFKTAEELARKEREDREAKRSGALVVAQEAVPASLRGFLNASADESLFGNFQIIVTLDLPDALPLKIEVWQDDAPNWVTGDFVVPEIVSARWDDERGYISDLSYSRHAEKTEDLEHAIALAFERWPQYQEEQNRAELLNKQNEERRAMQPTGNLPITPSTGERLVSLIEEIALNAVCSEVV
jgi:hypothetical protein